VLDICMSVILPQPRVLSTFGYLISMLDLNSLSLVLGLRGFFLVQVVVPIFGRRLYQNAVATSYVG
jgi:hypothetical protein